MRKYIIGGLVGFLLAIPFTSFGEQISMVGKKVKNEYSVLIDGKKLDKKAISIDGTSYAPLRVVADAVGYDIAFTGDTVVLSNPNLEGEIMATDTPTVVPSEVPTTSPFTLKEINFSIEKIKSNINFAKQNIDRAESLGNAEVADDQRQYLSEQESQLIVWEDRKAALEAQQ